MARTFTTASSQYVGFTPRAWGAWNGITIATLFRRNATGVYHTLYFAGTASAGVDGPLQLGITNGDDPYFGIGGTSRTLATTITAANQFLACSKATGTSTPVAEFSVAPFTTWTGPSNMSGTLADPATTATGIEEIGRWDGDSDYFGGDIEWLGIWAYNMSSAERRSLPMMSPRRIVHTFPGLQRFYWFNQPISDTVRDLSNNMADQTARTGTTHTVNNALMPNMSDSWTSPLLSQNMS